MPQSRKSKEDAAWITPYLPEISGQDGLLLRLRYRTKLSIKELAMVYEEKEKTIAQRLRRAFARVRKKYGQAG